MRSANVYVVRPGDSADRIAALYTGDASRWPELTSVNPQATGTMGGLPPGHRDVPQFRDLKVGQTIFVPRSWGTLPDAVPANFSRDFSAMIDLAWNAPVPPSFLSQWDSSMTYEQLWVSMIYSSVKKTADNGAHIYRPHPHGFTSPGLLDENATEIYKKCEQSISVPGGMDRVRMFLHKFKGPNQLVAAFDRPLSPKDVDPLASSSGQWGQFPYLGPAGLRALKQATNAFVAVCNPAMGIRRGTFSGAGFGATEQEEQEEEVFLESETGYGTRVSGRDACDPGSPITDVKPYAFRTGTHYPYQVAKYWTGNQNRWHELRRANYDDPDGFSMVVASETDKACLWNVWGGGKAIKIPANWPDVPAMFQNDIVDVEDAFPGTYVSDKDKAGMPWYWIPAGIAAAVGLALAWGARPKVDTRAQKA